eukprot:6999515-Pyramimonas_sp.AAC.1
MENAMELIQHGQLSHAARNLTSPGLAPGTDATLTELSSPDLRPPKPAERAPDGFRDSIPHKPLALDRNVFATVLRQRD